MHFGNLAPIQFSRLKTRFEIRRTKRLTFNNHLCYELLSAGLFFHVSMLTLHMFYMTAAIYRWVGPPMPRPLIYRCFVYI